MGSGHDPSRYWEGGNLNAPWKETKEPLSRRRRQSPAPPVESGPPAHDAGGDPSAAAGHDKSPEQPEEPRRVQWIRDGRDLGQMTVDEFLLSQGSGNAAPTQAQASSSPAPPTYHKRVEMSGGTSLLPVAYTKTMRARSIEKHRRLQQDALIRRLEDDSDDPLMEMSDDMTDQKIFRVQSMSDSAGLPSKTKEHPSEVSSSEHGTAVTELPRLEGLSLSDPSVLTPQIAEESDSDDDAYVYDNDDDDVLHEPIEFGIGSFDPQTLCYSDPRPQFKWAEDVPERGQLTLQEIAAELGPSRSGVQSRSESSFSPKSTEKNPTKDSDDELEEELRLIREYRATHTYTSLREGFDALIAAEHASLTELAAKMGTELPPPLPAKHVPPVHQEAQLQHATAPRKPRCEVSQAELAGNAEKWMCEEVKKVFEKYIERRDDLKGLDWCFSKLCHQCFNVGSYNKIFHHYNFTVRMKEPNSVDWVVALYFAEVKKIFGRKYYFCCRLEPNENGKCYACESQGIKDLQHPATGGFDRGSPNVGFGLMYD